MYVCEPRVHKWATEIEIERARDSECGLERESVRDKDVVCVHA